MRPTMFGRDSGHLQETCPWSPQSLTWFIRHLQVTDVSPWRDLYTSRAILKSILWRVGLQRAGKWSINFSYFPWEFPRGHFWWIISNVNVGLDLAVCKRLQCDLQQVEHESLWQLTDAVMTASLRSELGCSLLWPWPSETDIRTSDLWDSPTGLCGLARLESSICTALLWRIM